MNDSWHKSMQIALKIIQPQLMEHCKNEKIKNVSVNYAHHKLNQWYLTPNMVTHLPSKYSWMLISWSSFLKVFFKTYQMHGCLFTLCKWRNIISVDVKRRHDMTINWIMLSNLPQGFPTSCCNAGERNYSVMIWFLLAGN